MGTPLPPAPAPPRQGSPGARPFWQRPAVRLAGAGVAAASLVFAFRNADLPRIASLISSAPGLLLVPLLYLLNLTCDTLGWQRLLGAQGHPTGFFRLLRVRLSAEAVGLSLPSGTVLAEGVSTYLCGARCGVSAPPALASLAVRRLSLILALGLTLTAAAIVGFSDLRAISVPAIHRPGLEWIPVAAAAILFASVLGARGVLARGAAGRRLHQVLAGIPIARLRAWLEHRAEAFTAVDRQTAVAFAHPRAGGATLPFFVAVWVLESVETFAILHLLGAGLSFRQVFSFESPLAALRALAFFVPSGLGVQDVGYLLFLRGYGVPQAVTLGAAFVLVKRAKEIFWILVGYLLLTLGSPSARDLSRPSRAASSP